MLVQLKAISTKERYWTQGVVLEFFFQLCRRFFGKVVLAICLPYQVCSFEEAHPSNESKTERAGNC